MATGDREDLRRRRREEECGTPPPVPEDCKIIHSRDRRPNPCNEEDLPDLCEIDRDAFYPPQPPPAPTLTPYDPPDRITLANAEASASCDPGENFSALSTSPVTVPENTFFRLTEALMKYNEQVEDQAARDALSPDKGDIIYVRKDDIYWRFMDPGWEDMSAYIHPQVVQAYKDRVNELQAELDERALESAELSLDCFYTNTEQTAQCADDENEVPALDDPAFGTNYSATVAADTYRSYTSQAVADEQAEAEAESLLVCLWGNQAATITCDPNTAGDPNPPGTGSITLDTNNEPVESTTPQVDNGFERVGTISVDANVVLSPTSRADADDTAEDQARVLLSCLYLNEEQTGLCDGDGAGKDAEEHTRGEPLSTGETHHNALDGGTGNPTVVPALNISGDTITDANAIAQSLADAALECYWTNDTPFDPDDSCPSDTSLPDFDAPETTLVVGGYYRKGTADPYQDVVRVTALDPVQDTVVGDTSADIVTSDGDAVAEGEIISYISVADANNQADIIARSRVTCLYCNAPVPEKCNDHNNTSDDHTDPVPGGLFCEPELANAQDMALAQSAIPNRLKSTGGVSCSYSNDERLAACVNPEATDTPSNAVFVFNQADIDDGNKPISSASSPSGEGEYVSVAAGSFTIDLENWDSGTYPNSPKDQVNAQAEELALLFTDCFFENPDGTAVSCGDTIDGSGNHVAGDSTGYSPRSNNNTGVTITLAAGITRSYTSYDDAVNKAKRLGVSLLNCFFENPPMLGYCGFRLTPGSGGSGLTFEWNLKTGISSPVNIDNEDDAEKIELEDKDGTLVPYLVSGTGELGGTTTGNPVSTNATGYRGSTNAGEFTAGDTPIRVEKGTFTSTTSRVEAILQAAILIDSMLDCFFENDRKEPQNCPPGTYEAPHVDSAGDPIDVWVEADSVRSYESKAAADLRAQEIANGLQTCIATSEFQGDPGDQGPSGNCENNCISFYS